MNLLLIGGTGIIGGPTELLATKEGFQVTCIGRDGGKGSIALNKFHGNYVEQLEDICKTRGPFDGVIDICSYSAQEAQQNFEACHKHTKHFVVLSTTLVYDRQNLTYRPIPSNQPLARKGMYGGYVDNKIALEGFWKGISITPWTILRPYHVLGKESLLGCLPIHNRDPALVTKIRAGKEINLCDGGRVPLSVVHPQDIAKVALAAIKTDAAKYRCFNVVNPCEVTARDYYETVAKQLGLSVRIRNISSEKIWKDTSGWQMTILPHVYCTKDLEEIFGFVPNISLRDCISDALSAYDSNPISNALISNQMNLLPSPQTPTYFTE